MFTMLLQPNLIVKTSLFVQLHSIFRKTARTNFVYTQNFVYLQIKTGTYIAGKYQ